MKNIDLTNKKALLIDCDGTVADTMSAHAKAYELAFALNDVPFNINDHNNFAPLGGKVLMEQTVIKNGYGNKVDDIVRDKQKLLQICLERYIRPNVELIDLIRRRPEGMKAYIVTNGRRNSIRTVLNILGLTYHIDGLISPEVLGSVKPSPEPYNYAMVVASMDLGENVGPEDVIVFEDNQVGIDSALAAGITNIIKVNTEDFSHEKI